MHILGTHDCKVGGNLGRDPRIDGIEEKESTLDDSLGGRHKALDEGTRRVVHRRA